MSNPKKILFLTEANSEVGMGHFYQSYALAEHLQEHDVYFAFDEMAVVPDMVRRVTEHQLQMYHNLLNIEAIVDEIEPDVVIFNFRNFPESINRFLFFEKQIKTIVYDDNGGIKLAAHRIVNYTFTGKEKKYGVYSSPEETIPLFGTKYFPLRKEFFEITPTPNNSDTITIFMGGSDRSNVSHKIALDILEYKKQKFNLKIVTGKANKNEEALKKRLKAQKNIQVLEDIDNIAAVFAHSFLVVNTGGSALYELAFLGIPTIVLWEDTHEFDLANHFSKHGFSLIVNQCEKYTQVELHKALDFFMQPTNHEKHRLAGKKLVKAQQGLAEIKSYINKL